MASTENAKTCAATDPPSILSKAFEVLRAFDSANRVMTLTEIVRASGMPKSTVHRLLSRLVELDVLEEHGDTGYKVGLGLMRIGAVTPALAMRDSAIPYLHSLQQWTGHTVHLAVLRQLDVVYIEALGPFGRAPTVPSIGIRTPAHCTSAGKALLARSDLDELARSLPSPLPALTGRSQTSVDALISELREVRRAGYARETNEHRQGFASVGAAIEVNGVAVGAISIGHPSGTPLEPKVSLALREAVSALARSLRTGLTPDRVRWIPSNS